MIDAISKGTITGNSTLQEREVLDVVETIQKIALVILVADFVMTPILSLFVCSTALAIGTACVSFAGIAAFLLSQVLRKPPPKPKVVKAPQVLSWGEIQKLSSNVQKREQGNKLLKEMGWKESNDSVAALNQGIDQMFHDLISFITTQYMGCCTEGIYDTVKSKVKTVSVPCDSPLYEILYKDHRENGILSTSGMISGQWTWNDLFKGKAFREAFDLYIQNCPVDELKRIDRMVKQLKKTHFSLYREDPCFSPFFQQLMKDVEAARKDALRDLLPNSHPLLSDLICEYDAVLSPVQVTVSCVPYVKWRGEMMLDYDERNLVAQVRVQPAS